MRKWTACIAVLGIATLGFGLLRTVTRQEARALAQGEPRAAIESPAYVPLVATAAEPDPFQPLVAPTAELDPFQESPSLNEAVGEVVAENSPPRSRPRRLTEAEGIVLPEESVDFAGPRRRQVQQDPAYLIEGTPDSGLEPVQQAAALPTSVTSAPRVTMILTADHQIQLVPAGIENLPNQALPATAVILITAEKFQLIPPTEPGVGNQINCSGAVAIRSPQFTASGTKLSIHKGELVLEGTNEDPAVVTKTAHLSGTAATRESSRQVPTYLDDAPRLGPAATPTIDDGFVTPRAPAPRVAAPPAQTQVVPPPAPEFRVSANRITFT